MIRRFNYTGRKKLSKTRVVITLLRSASDVLAFDADLQLAGLGIPLDSHVYLEAYYKTSFRRFDFGTVGNPIRPANRNIDDIGGDIVFFRVRVVDLAGEHGRIIAEVDGLSPSKPGQHSADRTCLLYVNFKDLGEAVWRVEFDNPMPVLEVNERIEDVRSIVATDRTFRALVYPAAVREILQRILIVEERETTEEDGEWQSLWLRFVSRFHAAEPPRFDPESDASEQARLGWIEDAVRAFCGRIGARENFAAARQESAP